MTTVFIDGSAGTTGLRIYERLAERKDISLIKLDEQSRKDPKARSDAMNASDIVFLCLPDAAATEAITLLTNANTVLIDTSTAHRTAPGWVYGFPELSGQREKIRSAKRIANPGCHATGFIVLVAPLVRAGILSHNAGLTCFSLTGYSGGGKQMIAAYRADERDPLLDAPRQYGLNQSHKHLREMQAVTGLSLPPVFCPVVCDYYSGMEVTVPLFATDVCGGADAIRAKYSEVYGGNVVRYNPDAGEAGFASASAFAGYDDLEVTVQGNDERILLIARFDNLGKGASGAAIQNMNLAVGADETTGLILSGQ